MTDQNKTAATESPTAGMTLGQRVAHVGGRINAQGYVEFGSEMAVDALIQHVLRDRDLAREAKELQVTAGSRNYDRIRALDAEVSRLKALGSDLGRIIHDMTVAEQAAWIEWQHGRGAEAAMVWIQNGLIGPGHIPDEDEPYGKEAKAWFDSNRSNPFPKCFCGRPSNILWMGQGFCSEPHYRQVKAEYDAKNKDG